MALILFWILCLVLSRAHGPIMANMAIKTKNFAKKEIEGSLTCVAACRRPTTTPTINRTAKNGMAISTPTAMFDCNKSVKEFKENSLKVHP